MNKSAEFLIAIVIIVLVLAGVLYYAFSASHVQAPTATSTSAMATSTASTASTSASSTQSSTGGLMLRNYTDPNNTFSFDYPNAGTLSGSTAGYTQDWMVNAAADGLLLVKVEFPGSLQPGTNFAGADFTVGTSPNPDAVASCLSVPSNAPQSQKTTVTINGVQFTKVTESDAGAGNFYDTTSYRAIHNGQCYAIEYTIHSGDIGNYPPGTITQFNEANIQNLLESIVQSFKFGS